MLKRGPRSYIPEPLTICAIGSKVTYRIYRMQAAGMFGDLNNNYYGSMYFAILLQNYMLVN